MHFLHGDVDPSQGPHTMPMSLVALRGQHLHQQQTLASDVCDFKTRGSRNSQKKRERVKMTLASGLLSPRSDFSPSWSRICRGSWPWQPSKLCLPLNLTPNPNFLTLLRLDVSCGPNLASDSRALPPPCPSSASFHTPKPDLQSQPTSPAPTLHAPALFCLSADGGCDRLSLNCSRTEVSSHLGTPELLLHLAQSSGRGRGAACTLQVVLLATPRDENKPAIPDGTQSTVILSKRGPTLLHLGGNHACA